MIDGWEMMPSGRWCTSMEAHKGHLFLHAFVSGAWAVTRGQLIKPGSYTILVRGADEGQMQGADLDEAMKLAKAAATIIADAEHPCVSDAKPLVAVIGDGANSDGVAARPEHSEGDAQIKLEL